MSATNRGNKRHEGDFYPTPDVLARKIAEMALFRDPENCSAMPFPARILEPSAGSGAFVRACVGLFGDLPDSVRPQITAVEPERGLGGMLLDADEVWLKTLEHFAKECPRDRFDLIIGNPPFSLAEEHIRLCLGLLAPRGRLVFLLPLSFLASAKRRAFFVDHPPAMVGVLSERPSFVWSWTCPEKPGGCGHKWIDEIGKKHAECPKCRFAKLTCTKTDAQDYAVFTWIEGHKGPAELGWM